MTEECGKTTLVREVRKGEAVLYSSTPAVYSEKSNVRANVNALRYPRDIRCSTGLSVYDLTVTRQSIYFSLRFLRSIILQAREIRHYASQSRTSCPGYYAKID
jgi:hypothetical protein